MAQAQFEVQTFDGHGWVTRHRGADVDAAGEVARLVLPDAKKRAVRIVKQSFDVARQQIDRQVVFALGKPRKRVLRRTISTAAALTFSVAALVGATMIHQIEPERLIAMVGDAAPQTSPEIILDAGSIAAAGAALADLTPAAGQDFDCEREAQRGLVRAGTLTAQRERLFQLCGQAIEGNVTAQADLAGLLATGAGVDADPAQAIHWYQAAARAGHTAAYRPLADLLMASAGPDADPERAVAWYHRAALGGDVDAAVALGRIYREGIGVESDVRIALSYDLIAAESGDVGAMRRAAEAFLAGDGSDINPDAAARWLERAGASGDPIQAGVVQAGPGAEPDASGQSILWTSPADAELAPTDSSADRHAALDIVQLSPVPAGHTLAVPALHLDYDHDAREISSGFAGGPSLASV